MDPTFGARLRLQREQRGIALAAIAEQTKIKLSMLEALERDDVSHWPQGIFGRSYIRAYARAVGLEPDRTVREFLAFHPDAVEETPGAVTEPPSSGSGSRTPPMRLRFLIGSAIRALPALRVQPGRQSAPELPEPSVVAPDLPPAASDDSSAGHAHGRVDVPALADVCTRLARALEVDDVAPALQDAASALGAVGLILWIHDPRGSVLAPALAHGYSDEALARLPRVSSHTDNAIASAFRSVETRVVHGSESATGALVVPLSGPAGCAGVLALEFRHGAEQHEDVRACATILAAQLSTLFESATLAQVVNA